ncbi:dihydrofolate reductase-like domain-containing protein [Gilbertella persicaria]|uniref:dihydrofolate reductase-like domain-containing protein n=1 Tax=Gilbertella persicaria TaxID=101096 RepID=UPI002220B522|nr:dihydrofolate reductase-like domain-containing protein [Gilbertella persicaria]KAI8090192.1 dihydrofolate reductase-like domain-containing protein [Gilbertella persicaria]
MNETLFQQVRDFLDPIYANKPSFSNRPFVTLTFAQSLDGKIAKQNQQVLISGKESMAMTHYLRTLHDGILIGIGTALVDNPQLNARYVSCTKRQPQPIVLDPFLKLELDCKLVTNYQQGIGKQPWLIVSEKGCQASPEKKVKLENAGVKLVCVPTRTDRIPLEHVLEVLKQEGIHTLMIEGGSRIIQSCLKNEWDQLIVTIGPMFIGSNGVSAITDNDMVQLDHVQYQTMGKDIVMTATK